MSSPAIRGRAVVAVLAVLAIAPRLANFNNVSGRTPDEQVYTSQAIAWLEHGHAGLLANMADYENNPEVRQFPAPTRVGMIRLVAAAIRGTGRRDAGAGAIVSLGAGILSLLVFTLMGLRFFPIRAFVFALLFAAVSPLELAISRRNWSDALVELAGIAMAYIACEITQGARSWIWYPVFGAVGGAGITIKEYTALPFGLCGLWILGVLLFRRRDRFRALALIGWACVGTALAVWWLAASVGGAQELVRVVSSIPSANAVNSYALEYASGPGYLLPAALFAVSPVAAAFSGLGLWVAVRPSREFVEISPMVRCMAAFWVALLLFAMLVPHWLNLRYVAPGYGPFYLLAGIGFERLYVWCRARLGASEGRVFALLAIGLVAADAWTDYDRFERVFVRDGVPDLSVGFLLGERGR